MEMEIRRTQDYPGALCEIRAGDEGDSPKLAGLGAPYGVWSEDLGGGFGKFRERFEVGAFRSSVAADDIRALYNHESGQVLGRVSAGTLRLNETERGIEYEIDLPDTSFARDLAVSVERKDVTGNSFGFTVPDPDTDQRWEERDGTVWRTITRAKMRELGPQPFPAYPQTDVENRSLRSVWEQARRALGPTLEHLEAAITHDPRFTLAQYILGQFLLLDNRPGEAVAHMQVALDNAYRLPERFRFPLRSNYYRGDGATGRGVARVGDVGRTLSRGPERAAQLPRAFADAWGLGRSAGDAGHDVSPESRRRRPAEGDGGRAPATGERRRCARRAFRVHGAVPGGLLGPGESGGGSLGARRVR